MKRPRRRLLRRCQSVAFLVWLARSYQGARLRGRTRSDAIRFALAVARWHHANRTAHP